MHVLQQQGMKTIEVRTVDTIGYHQLKMLSFSMFSMSCSRMIYIYQPGTRHAEHAEGEHFEQVLAVL